MQSLTWSQDGYSLDGRPFFLVSGEFHYFRVPHHDWERRLTLFKEAGGNSVATYIPWILHEPTEGDIRFGDQPYRDLDGFLTLCRQLELFVTARPGPYQYSEMKYDGLPGWLCDGYPQLLARDRHGKSFRGSSVSYLHPLFLEKARRWFDAVCPIIARHTVSRGGAVAFAQYDNELMGIHEWFSGWDYHPDAMGIGQADGRYPRFLAERFAAIDQLNQAYEADFSTFAAVRPFMGGKPRNEANRRQIKDYQDFYFAAMADYAAILVGWMRELGIDCDIVHNSANPYMNSYHLETVKRLASEGFILGSDHYYNLSQDWDQNNPTPKYATKCFYSFEMLRLMGMPPTVYELPGGSASDWPPVLGEDLLCCYMTNLALGMKGSNYYIFTGGPNPENIGVLGDVYDFQAAIGPDGELRPHYQTMKSFGLYLQRHAWLAGAHQVTDCRLALDWDQSYSKYVGDPRGDLSYGPLEAWAFWRKGVMISLLCASHAPALANLASDAFTTETDQPLLVATCATMRADYQRRLVAFLQAGGRLLLAPVVPTLDEHYQPCTILADFLGLTTKPLKQTSPSVTVGPIHNVFANGGLWQAGNTPLESHQFATEERSNTPVGLVIQTPGGGQVAWLGLEWRHAMQTHCQMVTYLLKLLGGSSPLVAASTPYLWTSLRSDGERAMLFVMNLFSSPVTGSLTVNAPTVPAWASGPLTLAPMEVRTFISTGDGFTQDSP